MQKYILIFLTFWAIGSGAACFASIRDFPSYALMFGAFGVAFTLCAILLAFCAITYREI